MNVDAVYPGYINRNAQEMYCSYFLDTIDNPSWIKEKLDFLKTFGIRL